MGITKHRFSIFVNCHLPWEDEMTDGVQDFEELYEDRGFIILPESYTETGEATRLIIFCHGAGGCVSADDAQVEHSPLTEYLVANGYAVMDVNGLPFKYAEEHDIDIRNNIGSPIAIRSYVKAYHYCMDRYNLKRDVFVHGGSMGGISSTNLVLSGQIPVIAHSAFCPVLDAYNEIFLHPWSKGLPKVAMGKIYQLEKNEDGEYIYDERKLAGFNPAANKKAEVYPVPVKFWHSVDDHVVSHAVTEKFVETIKKNGGTAYLRSFPYGRHSPRNVGGCIENPCGIHTFDGREIEVTPGMEEVFIWIRNFS